MTDAKLTYVQLEEHLDPETPKSGSPFNVSDDILLDLSSTDTIDFKRLQQRYAYLKMQCEKYPDFLTTYKNKLDTPGFKQTLALIAIASLLG